MIARLASALRRAGRLAVERPRTASWTTLALTCALFAVAVAGVAALTIDRWAAERPGSTARMVVYLGEGVTDARAEELTAELRTLRGVERADLVPPTESARRLVAALGADVTLLEGVEIESLPGSVEVTLAPGVHDVVAMSPTVRALRGAPGVADVVVEEPHSARDRGDELAATLANVRSVAWGAAFLFAALAVFMVLAAIRVRLDRDRHEVAVAELLGAGPGFFLIPSALAGALQGLVAALLATGLLVVVIVVHGASVAEAFALSPDAVAIPGTAILALFVAASATLGLLGGGLAGAARVRR